MRNAKHLFITLFLFQVSVIAWAATENTSKLVAEGREFLAKGQYNAAEIKFRQAAESENDPEAWMLLGTVLNRKQAYNEALEALNKAKQLKTDSNAIHFETGCAYMGIGRYKDAYRSFAEDISYNNPWRNTAYLFCGICLYNLGEYEKTIALLSTPMLEGTEHSANAYYYTGLSQLKLKEHKKAAQSFRQAMWNAPKGTQIESDAKKMLVFVENTINAERRKRPWYASITTALSLDTNVISAGDKMTLPSDISNRRDVMNSLLLSAGYRLYQTLKSELWVDYRGSAAFQHDLNDYNTLMQSIALRASHLLSPKLKAGMNVNYDYIWVGGSPYSGIVGLSPSITYRQTDWTASTLTYTWQRAEYLFKITNPALDRDGYTNTVALTQDVAVPKTELYLRGGLHQSWIDSEGDDYDSDSSAVSLALWHPFLLQNSRISGGFSYAWDDYDKINSRSTDFRRRDDKRLTLSCGLSKEITEDITGFISYTRIENNSDIGVFDYNRQIYSVGVTYRF